jgi:hypothetical protein
MLLVTRNQRLCPSIDRMSSLGSDDKGRVFITTSTGSAKVSIASINSTTSRLLYADALTCSERRATSRYSKPSVRSISGTSSSRNIIRTTSPAAHHSTGQPSRTMPYRAQSSQSHDTTHDATQSAVLREEVSSLLQPAMGPPSSGTLLCGPFLPATPSPKAFMRSAQRQGKQAC